MRKSKNVLAGILSGRLSKIIVEVVWELLFILLLVQSGNSCFNSSSDAAVSSMGSLSKKISELAQLGDVVYTRPRQHSGKDRLTGG